MHKLYFNLLVLFFATLLVGMPNISNAYEKIGKVIMSTGTVIADQEGVTRTLKRGGAIYLGDAISTGPRARVHIRFNDKTLVELDKSTIFIVNQYIYDTKNPSRSIQESSLLKGGFRTITGLISKQDPRKYKVNTPVATIGIRSTIFSLLLTGGILPEDMTLWLTVFKGTACAGGLGSHHFNACFSSGSDTPNAKITTEQAVGMSQIDLSDMSNQEDDIQTANSDDEENFERGDMKSLNQDFINSFSSGLPSSGENSSEGEFPFSPFPINPPPNP